MIYKFRVILDVEEDIFRDIAIMDNTTLEDFHNVIVNAFGFDGIEMASFYTCDQEWMQKEEISIFDTGDIAGEQKIMSDYVLSELLDENNRRLIYVYDFLNMWTFLIELTKIEEHAEEGKFYPLLLSAYGKLPIEAPVKAFKVEGDFDNFDEDEDFGDEENWN